MGKKCPIWTLAPILSRLNYLRLSEVFDYIPTVHGRVKKKCRDLKCYWHCEIENHQFQRRRASFFFKLSSFLWITAMNIWEIMQYSISNDFQWHLRTNHMQMHHITLYSLRIKYLYLCGKKNKLCNWKYSNICHFTFYTWCFTMLLCVQKYAVHAFKTLKLCAIEFQYTSVNWQMDERVAWEI